MKLASVSDFLGYMVILLWLDCFDSRCIGADAHNPLKTLFILKGVDYYVFAGMGIAFNTHGFAMYLNHLPDAVLCFGDKCEFHGILLFDNNENPRKTLLPCAVRFKAGQRVSLRFAPANT